MRYFSPVKKKVTEVTIKFLCTKFGLRVMCCPHLSYIVLE